MNYEICNPANVAGFEPVTSYDKFKIQETAGDEIANVNNCVKACCTDIDGVIASLNTLRTKMGENTGTTSQIDRIVKSLQDKRQDLITKNQELIDACNQVLQYVYTNKTEKSAEATQVAQTIANIDIYKG